MSQHCKPFGKMPDLGNQRGMALITAIALIAIMSVLGAVLMNTSTSEIQLSGNFRNMMESFYAADRGVEYAYQNATLSGGTVDLYNGLDADGNLHRDQIALGNDSGLEPSAITVSDDRNSVRFIGSGPPPVGSGSDASMFEARYYQIHVVGAFPASSPNPSRTSVRTQVAKIVPK